MKFDSLNSFGANIGTLFHSYTRRFLLLYKAAKITADRVQVKYRLNFATIAAQYMNYLMLNSNQSARFHFKTFLVFVTNSYYILEMVDT